MVKKIFLYLIAVMFFASCQTTPNIVQSYAIETSSLPILQTGRLTYDSNAEKNDIIIDGTIGDSSAGALWWWFSKGHTVRRTWDGTISDNNNTYSLNITCLADNEKGDSAFYENGEENAASDSYFTTGGLSDFEISSLPNMYSIDNVVPPTERTWLYPTDFPSNYMDFFVDNKKFSVLLTTMHGLVPVFGDDTPIAYYDASFLSNDQLFQIVDTEGLVYAEFTPGYLESVIALKYFFQGYERRDGTYTIFDVDDDFDETKLIPVIAMIDVMKYFIEYSEMR